MTPYQAHRDARLIELDMLDCCSLTFEDQQLPDYRPLLRRFSDRVGQLADKLQDLEQLSVEQMKDAERWKLLSREDINWKVCGDGSTFQIFQDIPNGKKLMGFGKTLSDAVDKTLGFK